MEICCVKNEALNQVLKQAETHNYGNNNKQSDFEQQHSASSAPSD